MASAIDPTKPAEGLQAVKADLRANLAAAKSEIEALQAATVGITPYSQSGMRNRIINGDFRIIQREFGTDTTIAAPQIAYQFDCWHLNLSTGGQSVKTYFRRSDAPVGFTRYARLESAGVSALGSTVYHYMQQTIEGTHIRDFMWGTASAKTITVSFWARASVAGNYAVSLLNGGATGATGSNSTRSYVASYTIANANVWEYKTITVTGDGSGVWSAAPELVGLRLRFDLGSGSGVRTTPGIWTAGEFSSFTGATSIMAVGLRTLDLTGVQVELGTVATPYDYRYDTLETLLCQRYYQRLYAILNYRCTVAGDNNGMSVMFPAEMMGIPTSTNQLTTVGELNVTSVTVSNNRAYVNLNWVNTAIGPFIGAREVRCTSPLV